MKKLFVPGVLLSLLTGYSNQIVSKAEAGPSITTSGKPESGQLKIGYARMERLINFEEPDKGAHEWRDRNKKLTEDIEGRAAQFMSKRERLEKMAAEFQNPESSKWSSEKAREAKAEEAVKLRDELMAEQKYTQDYVMRKRQELYNEGLQKAQKHAQDFAEKEGYDIVLGAGALYVSPRVDVTEKVIAAWNKEYDAEQEKAKKAGKKEPVITPEKKSAGK